MIRLKSADHDSANNTDSAALVNDLAAAEDAFLADVTNEANSLVASVYSFEKSGVASLKTKTKNADATLLGLVISNLASLDGVIAGLVNTFNTIEAGAWKTYTDAAAVGFTPPGTLCQPWRNRIFRAEDLPFITTIFSVFASNVSSIDVDFELCHCTIMIGVSGVKVFQ